MGEETPEDIRRGMRRRTKGENGRIKSKKSIEKKRRWKTFSGYRTSEGETS